MKVSGALKRLTKKVAKGQIMTRTNHALQATLKEQNPQNYPKALERIAKKAAHEEQAAKRTAVYEQV